MKKAFDWVDRDLLFFKLLNYNITGKIYWAIKSMYTNTQSCIQLQQTFTDWFSVLNGVKQGDNLSPSLFALYINDLVHELNSIGCGIRIGMYVINILLYADDIVLVAENENILQKLLDKLYEWCSRWHLEINESKSNVMHFRKSRKLHSNIVFKIGNTKLDYVKTYRYLGVTLDENLSFNAACQELNDAGGRAFGGIVAKFKQFKHLSFKCFTKLFDTGVEPICTYASSVWGFNKFQLGQKLQLRAIRYFLGVHKYTPTLALTADFGWLDMKYKYYLNILQFYNRLLSMNNDRLTRQAFEADQNHMSSTNWSGMVKQILSDIGKESNIENFEKIDINFANEKFKVLTNREYQENAEIKPKLRTYKLFKRHVETEKYVTAKLSRYERSLIAKFRSGTLQLAIETGRFRNIEINDRLCISCNQNQVEDEIHFLCFCPFYHDLRQKLYSDLKIDPESFENNYDLFIEIMRSERIYCLSSFIVNAWGKRRDFIYNSDLTF